MIRADFGPGMADLRFSASGTFPKTIVILADCERLEMPWSFGSYASEVRIYAPAGSKGWETAKAAIAGTYGTLSEDQLLEYTPLSATLSAAGAVEPGTVVPLKATAQGGVRGDKLFRFTEGLRTASGRCCRIGRPPTRSTAGRRLHQFLGSRRGPRCHVADRDARRAAVGLAEKSGARRSWRRGSPCPSWPPASRLPSCPRLRASGCATAPPSRAPRARPTRRTAPRAIPYVRRSRVQRGCPRGHGRWRRRRTRRAASLPCAWRRRRPKSCRR